MRTLVVQLMFTVALTFESLPFHLAFNDKVPGVCLVPSGIFQGFRLDQCLGTFKHSGRKVHDLECAYKSVRIELRPFHPAMSGVCTKC